MKYLLLLVLCSGCGFPTILPLANTMSKDQVQENKDSNAEMSKRAKVDYPPQGATTWSLGPGAYVTGDAATSQKLADALIQATSIRANADVQIEQSKQEQLKIKATSESSQQLNALGYALAGIVFVALAWIITSWLKSSSAGRAALAAADAAGETVFNQAKEAIHRIDDKLATTNDDKAAYDLLVEKNRILHDALDKVKK